MATVVKNTTAKAIGSYVGETNQQIREGFGVYSYLNKYFRYEGEWKEGKKHGHGRLLMGDGSFYEGSFENGEIQGHGYRKWTSTNNAYTGQFERGELCGTGVMSYSNGDKYEGSWLNNQREGNGCLTQDNGCSYKGSFHQHKRHGQGYQIYSSGDEYEGEWVRGKKQGHGTMKYHDGTIYDGQWRDDMFNGEGSVVHVSGVMYEGLWMSGRPAVEAFTLSIKGLSVIDVEQGQTFSIEIECQSVDGEVTQEDGRTLEITAGRKIIANKNSDSKPEAEPVEKIPTPFDFDVELYPIMELAPGCDAPVAWWTGLGTNEGRRSSLEPPKSAGEDLGESQVSDESKDSSSPRQATPYDDAGSDTVIAPSVPPLKTIQGNAEMENLYLLPLPPGMKSYSSMLLDELGDAGKISEPSPKTKKRERRASVAPSSSVDVSDKLDSKESLRRKKEKKEQDKLLNEEKTKYCRPGDYVIIVQDVTDPPFLDAVLKPAYLHVKVTQKLKRLKSKERTTK